MGMHRRRKLGKPRASFTKEYILSIPKTINNNDCWIPDKVAESNGYVRISINDIRYLLHRVVMCLWYDIEYTNKNIETRHNKGCDRSCFNYEHLKSGTTSDNTKDQVIHGTHHEARKTHCPKCGGEYKRRQYRVNYLLTWFRYCPACRLRKQAEREEDD